jgi:hypothetical protein
MRPPDDALCEERSRPFGPALARLVPALRRQTHETAAIQYWLNACDRRTECIGSATDQGEPHRICHTGDQSQRHGPRRQPYRALFEELSRLGYIEGQNLTVDRYSGEGRPEQQLPDLARVVVSTHPDLILSQSARLALQFKIATSTIPIVGITSDPIVAGLVPSLARPGDNITGVSADAGPKIWGKRLGLLVDALPKLSNVRFLASRTVWEEFAGARQPKTQEFR